MEEINVNLDDVKPLCSRSSTKQEGPRRFPPASVLGLGLLAVFLLAGLIGLAVHQHNSVGGAAADLSAVKANLTEHLHASDQLLSSVTEERDGMMANLTEKTREVDRLQSLSKQDQDSVDLLTEERDGLMANLTEKTREVDRLQSLSKQNQDSVDLLTEERDGLMANLTEKTREVDRLQSLSKQNQDSVDLLTEERDGLMANLTEKTREVDRLQSLSKQNQDSVDLLTEERDGLMANLTEKTREVDRLQKKTCPAGWRMVSFVCYLFSTEKASWQQSRQNCRAKGADLVIIDSNEEQKFMTSTIKEPTWIGLNDIDQEGTWKWVDGSQPNQKYWGQPPDNGNGDPKWGEEDCACLVNNWNGENNWNDLRCTTPLQWICEKIL